MRFNPTLLAAALALTADLVASGVVQILPAGKFAARDGRPGPGKFWQLSDTQGTALAANLSTVAAKTPISIDYEHQSVLAATNGQAAPAAGWMTGFKWRAGAGLFATVNWTPRAKAYIAADEYRYISPVILFDPKTGDVVGLHNAALVANPAILGMEAVQAALSALVNVSPTDPTDPPAKKETVMDLTTLVALLGLAAGATAADVTTFLTALMARPLVPAALSAALGLPTTTDEAAALAALNRKLGAPDAATLQAMAALQAQVSTLRAQANSRAVNETVDAAIAAHKLMPAQRDWAVGLGTNDMAQLTAYLAATPAIPGLAGQTHGRQELPNTPVVALSASQALLAAQMGLDPAKYLAQLNLQAA